MSRRELEEAQGREAGGDRKLADIRWTSASDGRRLRKRLMVRPDANDGVAGRDGASRSASRRAAKSKRSARGRGGDDRLVPTLLKENSDSERFRLRTGMAVVVGGIGASIGSARVLVRSSGGRMDDCNGFGEGGCGM